MKNKLIVLIIIILLISGFVVYKNKKNINQTSLVKESSSEDLQIEEYLDTNILNPEYGGKIFCVFHKYGSKEINNKISYYLWTYCEEYYKKGNQILMGSGVSMPVRLNIEKDGNNLKIIGFNKPTDGEEYAKSIKEMFPEKYSSDAINGFDVTIFPKSPKEKADQYYNNQ
jgi:hypothetical protein